MISYARKIDALGGGAHEDDHDALVHTSGYNEAIGHATEIAEDADAMIAELYETINDLLQPGGYTTLKAWANDAETLLTRIRGRS
jgi:hypothetical protein